mgnify:FL=1
MRQILLIFLAVVICFSTGCALIQPIDPYGASGLDQEAALPLSPRGDAVSESLPKSLTLAAATAIALQRNPELRATTHDVEAAQAREDAAVAQRWPKLNARSRLTHFVNDQPLVAIGGNPQGQVFTSEIGVAELLVEMPLFTGGRITRRIEAGELLRAAAAHQLARTRHELTFNVASIFNSVLAQRRVIESLTLSRTALQEHLGQVGELIRNQKATRADRLRIQVRLANLQEDLAQARNVLQVKRYALANVLGFDQTVPDFRLAGELRFDEESPAPLADQIRFAYQHRSDYRSARSSLSAQAKQVDAARAELWPDVAVQASYGNRWDLSDTGHREDAGQVGVVLDMPLFQAGRIRAGIREEKAKLAAAQERLRALSHRVRLEVQTARSNVVSAKERVRATRKAVEQGKESLRVERLKHQTGEATVTDVLHTQADLLQSQTKYSRALADYNTALAELDFATGKDE